jgi:hypothetical protein
MKPRPSASGQPPGVRPGEPAPIPPPAADTPAGGRLDMEPARNWWSVTPGYRERVKADAHVTREELLRQLAIMARRDLKRRARVARDVKEIAAAVADLEVNEKEVR